MQYTDIGIDLGTASILVYIRGKGVVLKEPYVVAFVRDTDKINANGEEARLMLKDAGKYCGGQAAASGGNIRLPCHRKNDEAFHSESTGQEDVP